MEKEKTKIEKQREYVEKYLVCDRCGSRDVRTSSLNRKCRKCGLVFKIIV